jgi:hypothetical protein
MEVEARSSGLARLHRRLLPRFLFDLDQPKALYAAKAWLLCIIPSILLATLVTMGADDPPSPDFGGTGAVVFALIVLFAPVSETFLMVPPLLLLNRWLGPAPAIVGSAALWGTLHSMAEPLWGLIIWWPFLVFSAIIIAWRQRDLAGGMVMVIAVHAMQNAVAGLSLLFG